MSDQAPDTERREDDPSTAHFDESNATFTSGRDDAADDAPAHSDSGSEFTEATVSLKNGQISVEVHDDLPQEQSVDEDDVERQLRIQRAIQRAGFEPERPFLNVDTESLLALSGQIRQELANR